MARPKIYWDWGLYRHLRRFREVSEMNKVPVKTYERYDCGECSLVKERSNAPIISIKSGCYDIERAEQLIESVRMLITKSKEVF